MSRLPRISHEKCKMTCTIPTSHKTRLIVLWTENEKSVALANGLYKRDDFFFRAVSTCFRVAQQSDPFSNETQRRDKRIIIKNPLLGSSPAVSHAAEFSDTVNRYNRKIDAMIRDYSFVDEFLNIPPTYYY